MQSDMHFYGVYAIARAAGLKPDDAHTIAYASQYVDDSTKTDTEEHDDGGKMRGIATAHHNAQVAKNVIADRLEQRRVWVPFHFLPGGEGEDLSEKLICRMDSPLAQEMMRNHIDHALRHEYALQLMGIACHVYADTFSHWGFSGVCSSNNSADGDSFAFHNVDDPDMVTYLNTKFSRFMNDYVPDFVIDNWRKLASIMGEKASASLGHGAVGTYPDRPFLHWSFRYEKSGAVSDRDNPTNFLLACERMHEWLSEFARGYYGDETPGAVAFEDIRDEVRAIINRQAAKEGRIHAWRTAVSEGRLFTRDDEERHSYDPSVWEGMKDRFASLERSSDIIDQPVYRFHQAALYHRHFVLKIMLPRHGIAVY
ncbi:MAG: DUF6765 family protein [Gammaproteobacteria bacterium]